MTIQRFVQRFIRIMMAMQQRYPDGLEWISFSFVDGRVTYFRSNRLTAWTIKGKSTITLVKPGSANEVSAALEAVGIHIATVSTMTAGRLQVLNGEVTAGSAFNSEFEYKAIRKP